jgi:hypothetical protein
MDWSNVTRQFSPIEVYNNLNRNNFSTHVTPTPIDFSAHNYPAVATAMAALILAMAFIAWQALRSYSPRRAVA